MKYAICNFDLKSGTVKDDDGSLTWFEGELEEAMEKVKRNDSLCALFLPSDVPGRGVPHKADIDRETFEQKPGVYGVCYYKAWNGFAFE